MSAKGVGHVNHGYLAIQLNEEMVKRSRSHLILVQHTRDNLERLLRYMNYHRLLSCARVADYEPIAVSCTSLQTPITILDQGDKSSFKFSQLPFNTNLIAQDDDAVLIKPTVPAKRLSITMQLPSTGFVAMITTVRIDAECVLFIPSSKAQDMVQSVQDSLVNGKMPNDTVRDSLIQRLENYILTRVSDRFRKGYTKGNKASLITVSLAVLRHFCHTVTVKSSRGVDQLLVNASMTLTASYPGFKDKKGTRKEMNL